jgi:hypothetical protein
MAFVLFGLALAVIGMTETYLPEWLRPWAKAYAFKLALACFIGGLISLGINFHETYVLRSPVASHCRMRWPIAKRPSAPFGVSEQVFQAQIVEMDKLQEWLDDKSEDELRELFDYPNMLKFNVALAKERLAPALMSSNEVKELDAFNQHAKAMVSLQYGRLIPHPELKSLDIIPDEGQTVVINISDKYIEDRNKLSKFKQSLNLPLSVINAVGELDDALIANTQLIMDVLNQDFREDKNYVIFDNSPSSPYYGSTTKRYWNRFTPLQGKAEKIVSTIRAYLKTD